MPHNKRNEGGAVVGNFLTWLSGADSEVLTYFPGERAKYTALSGAMVATGLVATASMWFALHMALGVGGLAAVPVAAVWGAIIISVDRTLVVAMQRKEKWWVAVLLATTRLLLALVLGLVVSTPITLRVFESEINNRISLIKETSEANFLASQQKSPVQARVTQWQNTVNNLQQVIDSRGAKPIKLAADPVVQDLTAQLNNERTTESKDYVAWQCQLYGGCGAPKGSGPLAAASQQRYKADAAQVDNLTQQIQQRENQLQTTNTSSQQTRLQQAQNALPDAQAQLTAAQAEENSLRDNFQSTNAATGGLLIRLQALDQLTSGDFNLQAMRILLFLLFTIFEILPVLTKILQNLGRESSYDKGLEEAEKRRVKALQDAWDKADAEVIAELAAARLRMTRDSVRRGGGPQAGRGAAPGGRWFMPRRRPRPAGPIRPRTDFQQFDPSRANGHGPGS